MRPHSLRAFEEIERRCELGINNYSKIFHFIFVIVTETDYQWNTSAPKYPEVEDESKQIFLDFFRKTRKLKPQKLNHPHFSQNRRN